MIAVNDKTLGQAIFSADLPLIVVWGPAGSSDLQEALTAVSWLAERELGLRTAQLVAPSDAMVRRLGLRPATTILLFENAREGLRIEGKISGPRLAEAVLARLHPRTSRRPEGMNGAA